MGFARLTQDQSALIGAEHVPLLRTPVGGENGSSGKSGHGVLLLLLSPSFQKVGVQSATNARPLCCAEHVDKVKVCRHKGPQCAARHKRFDGARPSHRVGRRPC